MKTKRLCLWSGPRNVSTALMYAFDQRADTRCIDEPLYGHYLRTSGAYHPGGDDVVATMDCDGNRVVQEVLLGSYDAPMVFFKQMAHHLREIDWAFLAQTTNVLLTRDPFEVLPTLTQQIPQAQLADTGYDTQVRLLDVLRSLEQPLLVLDARELLLNPAGVLRQLCEKIDITFQADMLQWPAGPRDCDGVWAPHWYYNVHRSTGFAPYQSKTQPFPAHLEPLLTQCQPLYDQLYAHALIAN